MAILLVLLKECIYIFLTHNVCLYHLETYVIFLTLPEILWFVWIIITV